MLTKIYSAVLGPYTFQGINLINTFIQSFVCVGLFARRLGKKSFFPLRLAVALVEGGALCYLLAIWYTEMDTLLVRVICYLIITLLNLAALLFCWKDDMEEILLTFSSGIAAHWMVGKLYPLLQNFQGINDKATLDPFPGAMELMGDWVWLIYFGFHFLMFFLLSVLFTPKNRLVHNRRTTRNVLLLSLGTVVLVNVLICISRAYEQESWVLNMVTKTLFVAMCLTVLMACSGIFSQSEREQQLAVLQQLWRQDKAQFESIKANMDVINMKCHDLKHILGKIEGKLTEEEVGSLREAIEFYDSNIRTGNEVLDVVLCEKALTCQQSGIAFSCMADGAKLDFLSPVQIYSLVGNIIDNAVEAVRQVPAPEDKVISLTCRQEGDELVLEESNYFSGALTVRDGLPATVKTDASRHGYGTRSIQYIAQQYGGSLTVRTVGNMFFLTVRFPLKQAG